MNDSFVRRALLGLCAIALLLSLCFAIRVPYDSSPDEIMHHNYIRLLVEERGFVKFIPRGELPEGALGRDETHQPPLYYLLCIPVHLASGGNFVAVRMVNVAVQVATVALIFFACRDLFPKRPEIAIGAAAFAAMLPIQAQLGGSINNDPLTTLLCAAMFWQLGKLVLRGQSMRDVIMLGILFGLGLWTKVSVVQLVPVFVLAYFLAWRAGHLTFGKAFAQGAMALVLGTVIAALWLIRNTNLYGDPLAIKIYKLTGPNYSPQDMMQIAQWSQTDYLRQMGVRTFATFWYFLDPNLTFKQFTGSPLPLVVVLLLTLASLLLLYKKGKESGFPKEYHGLLWLFGLAAPVLMPFYLRFILTVFQAQGRYFLPALLPVAVLMAISLSARTLKSDEDKVPPKWLPVLIVPAVLLILAVFQLMNGGYMTRRSEAPAPLGIERGEEPKEKQVYDGQNLEPGAPLT